LRGLIAHAQHRFDDAVAEFTNLTEEYPQFPPGFYNLAYVLIDEGLTQRPVETEQQHLQRALEAALAGTRVDEALDKDSRTLAVGYATAGRALQYMGAHDPTKYNEALGYFERSLNADPLFIFAYVSQGRVYRDRRPPDVAKAIERYQRAKELDPSYHTYTNLAALLRSFDRGAEALPYLQRAAELNPTVDAYDNWGNVLKELGRRDEAKTKFEKAIAINPRVSNGYNQLGLLYLEEKKWSEAAEQFKKAIELVPKWGNYYYNLGRALRGGGKLNDAIVAFKEATENRPDHAWAYAQWGATLAQADQKAVTEDTARIAEQKLSKAAELMPRNATVMKTVGEGYELLGRPDQAIAFYRRAIALDPKANASLNGEVDRLKKTAGKL
jgi:tetratricopeptide (TPR) repeat protein